MSYGSNGWNLPVMKNRYFNISLYLNSSSCVCSMQACIAHGHLLGYTRALCGILPLGSVFALLISTHPSVVLCYNKNC